MNELTDDELLLYLSDTDEGIDAFIKQTGR